MAWWCINSDREPEVVADQVIERPAFREEYFQESVAILIAAFRDRDYPGPSGYAAEENNGSGPGNQAYEEARNLAYSTVSAVLARLHAALWT